MTKPHNITEDHIDLLHTIEKDGNASQREIAGSTGLSIGKVNYIIKALIDVGFIKINNFNMTLTAKTLKLDRVSLYRKVKSLKIKID